MKFTESNRIDAFTKITKLVTDKFYDPKFKGHDWPALIEKHRDEVLSQTERPAFEGAVNKMLGQLGTSGLGLISPQTRVSSKNAISATFHDSETEYGRRWVFQDVHTGGLAAKAGLKSGDVLMSVGASDIQPPHAKPLFAMGQTHSLSCQRITGQMNVTITIPVAKHAENPCSEPDFLKPEVSQGVAILKIPLFPGKLGIDFANKVTSVFDSILKKAERLVLDLRGNPGGGLGCLRLMSVLTSGRKPVGFSVDRAAAERGYDRMRFPRFGKIPSSKIEVPWLAVRFAGKKSVVLMTEGLGSRAFHNRVVVLVNEHTTCASEMVALFAREETGAKIVGTATPGRLVSHTGFKIDHGFTLALPVAAFTSWGGTRLDGTGILPDSVVEFSYADARQRGDRQLSSALDLCKNL